MSSAVVWFRRDLRLESNPAWAAATADHDEVLALYVLDERLLATAADHRRRFHAGCVAGLDRSLRELGGRLHLRRGDPTQVVPDVVAGHDALYLNTDVTAYSTRRDAAVEEALDVTVGRWWGTLHQPPGRVLTQKGTLSRVFTPFWKTWRDLDLDAWPEPGAASVADDPGSETVEADDDTGEAAALDRLDRWVRDVGDYGATRDLPAVDGTSRLSADLRFGTLSTRQVVDAVGATDDGTFVRQLAWRDWYAHLLHEHPSFATAALRSEYEAIEWRNDPDEISAWQEGRTGYPIVDAGMRQLNETGWMHNRVRMIAASFLVKDLLVDWRIGERWFRRQLVDFDVAQNVGNWQWVAGTGPDAAPYFRIFNPVTQSAKFDPDGEFIRRWVPELSDLPDDQLHAPWEAGPLDLEAAGVTLGDTYPDPLVDHAEARERCLEAYSVVKDG